MEEDRRHRARMKLAALAVSSSRERSGTSGIDEGAVVILRPPFCIARVPLVILSYRFP